MAKLDRALIQLVSVDSVKKIATLDAPKLTSNASRYVEANLFGYYLIINTWMMMIKQVSEYGWKFVLTHLQSVGLVQSIKEFDSAADDLVHGRDVSFGVARTIMADIKYTVPIRGIPFDDARNVVHDPMAAALLLFRYPKRFSPLYADLLKEASIGGFVATQRRMKVWQRRPASRVVLDEVREAASSVVNWNRLCCELENVDITDILFTPGVSFDTSSSLVSKLQSLLREHAEYFPMPFGIPVAASQGVEEQRYDGAGHEIHSVRLVVVPKNYKTGRVIAPENVYRQALARRYFVIADRFLPGEIKLHDQTQNQRLAEEGSITGDLATLDLSAASDSLTLTLLKEILPQRFMRIMDKILPTHYVNKGQEYLLHSAATMGNSMTFWLESVVFLSIARAAVAYYNRFADSDNHTISVYGDDIIVPTDAALTVMEWLNELGFIVNETKSYYTRDNLYRESCGEEYYNGINVSSVYFPRFPIEGKLGGSISDRVVRDSFTGTQVDTMGALIDLQHKMHFVCIPASLLISEVVREANPRMTYSTPDLNCQDLWSYEDLPVKVPAPSWSRVDGKLKKVGNMEYARDGHMGPITVYDMTAADKARFQGYKVLVDLYNYQQFLKYGPRYDDDLSKILGVTTPPISLEEASTSPKVKWVLIK
jgi:hypothetical protein